MKIIQWSPLQLTENPFSPVGLPEKIKLWGGNWCWSLLQLQFNSGISVIVKNNSPKPTTNQDFLNMEIYDACAQIYYCLNFSKITLHELQKNLTSSKLVFMVYKGLFIIYRKGGGGGVRN